PSQAWLTLPPADHRPSLGHCGDVTPCLPGCVKQLLPGLGVVIPVGRGAKFGACLGVLTLWQRHARLAVSSADSVRYVSSASTNSTSPRRISSIREPNSSFQAASVSA